MVFRHNKFEKTQQPLNKHVHLTGILHSVSTSTVQKMHFIFHFLMSPDNIFILFFLYDLFIKKLINHHSQRFF